MRHRTAFISGPIRESFFDSPSLRLDVHRDIARRDDDIMTYVNEQSVCAVGITFIVLGLAAVGARFYVRMQRHQGLDVDDWLCLPALVCSKLRMG